MSDVTFTPMEVVPLGQAPAAEGEMLKLIELAGRTAYRSEDKITDGSAAKFVSRLKKLGHLSVLEHSNIALEIWDGLSLRALAAALGDRNCFHPSVEKKNRDLGERVLVVAGNARAWLETCDILYERNDQSVFSREIAQGLRYNLAVSYSSLFGGWSYPADFDSVGLENATVAGVGDQISWGGDIPLFAFKIICDRGITHEIVRHRSLSFTQESTRYVNYNGKGFEFILPQHLIDAGFSMDKTVDSIPLDTWMEFMEYRKCCAESAGSYKHLSASYHLKPQIARDVLPNLLKSEIVVSGRWSGWRHFIELRDSTAAHPRIRWIAKEIRKWFEDIAGLTV